VTVNVPTVGTVTTRVVVVAEINLALTPLNSTMLELGAGEKFCPGMVTVVPTGPRRGVTLMVASTPGATVVRFTCTMFPAES
jgi:hypothetical protein